MLVYKAMLIRRKTFYLAEVENAAFRQHVKTTSAGYHMAKLRFAYAGKTAGFSKHLRENR